MQITNVAYATSNKTATVTCDEKKVKTIINIRENKVNKQGAIHENMITLSSKCSIQSIHLFCCRPCPQTSSTNRKRKPHRCAILAYKDKASAITTFWAALNPIYVCT